MKKDFKQALINKIKSLIGPVVLLLIMAVAVVFIVFYQEEPEPEEIVKVNGYEGSEEEIVLENDDLKFVMDPTTTQFYVEVKSTGERWLSNPVGAAEDSKALTIEKEKLQSTILLTYSTKNGVDTLYNNYKYSMQNQIYEIETGEDYVKVYYSIGDTEKEYIIPPVITADEFKQWLEKIDKAGALLAEEYYKKYDINKLSKRDKEIQDELLANYPIMETEVIYVLRDTTRDNIKLKLEEYFTTAGYTVEDLAAHKELDMSSKTSDKPVFNLNIVYKLDGKDLVVDVPLSEIEYKEDKPILYLSLLPYFGAAGVEDEGYMLVPEGGGAIIDFNNGKTRQTSYYANLYGWDMCLVRDSLVHETRTYYNVFGMAKGDNSFLCIMEEGAPYAAIQADISGRNHSYNFVNAVYSVTHREQFDVAERYNGSMFVYEPSLPDEHYTNRYRFIDSSSYVDMAENYHDYLVEKYGDEMQLQDDTSAPAVVEILAAVDKVKQICGIPLSRPLKLTSFEEAQEILTQLNSEGMTNIDVKLTGWMNGGVKQEILNKVDIINDLGSKKDLKNLISYVEENGMNIYLDGITDYAWNSDILDGFFSPFDAARLVSKEKAELYEYSTVTYSQRDGLDPYYLLNNANIQKAVEILVEETAELGAGVSFQNLGKDIASDFNRKATVTRQAALQQQEATFQKLASEGRNVMVNMGNDYAIAYVDTVSNMDLAGSSYTILDRTVPFYQLAIHGYVNYTGESLNLTQDFEQEILNSAEYGAGLSFTVMNETAFILQKTLYTQYFGADYSAWHDRMIDIYTRYNEELGHTFNQRMADHEWVTEKVACTTYEDGTKVYVNYGYDDMTVAGVTVPARDYKVVK
ncbi:MAG: hypothetical protein IJW63_03210 [Lachnospiraceae bacterium]|nr:hypothetical protein [Lachnospiraceae bacterium]